VFPSRRLPQDLVPADGVFLYLLWRPACNLREVNIPLGIFSTMRQSD